MFDILFLLFLNKKDCGGNGFLPLLGFPCQKEEHLHVFLSLKVTIKQRSWLQYWVIFRDKNTTKEQEILCFVNVCDSFITYLLLLCYGKVSEASWLLVLQNQLNIKFQISCGKVCMSEVTFIPATIYHCLGDKVCLDCYLTSWFFFLESLTKTSHLGITPSRLLNTFSGFWHLHSFFLQVGKNIVRKRQLNGGNYLSQMLPQQMLACCCSGCFSFGLLFV